MTDASPKSNKSVSNYELKENIAVMGERLKTLSEVNSNVLEELKCHYKESAARDRAIERLAVMVERNTLNINENRKAIDDMEKDNAKALLDVNEKINSKMNIIGVINAGLAVVAGLLGINK